MSTTNKDFKVKKGLIVSEGGTFGDAVTVGTPTNPGHATTKDYVDNISLTPGPTGPTGPVSTVAGPTGPTGASGLDGATGPTGPTGPYPFNYVGEWSPSTEYLNSNEEVVQESNALWISNVTSTGEQPSLRTVDEFDNLFWIPFNAGAPGQNGTDGLVVGSSAPIDTDILWLDTSVEGVVQQGPTGPAGYSAYEIAVIYGFVGTEQEWIDSLTADATSAAISTIVDSAPTTLDTLNELAAALGDDANFAATVATSLSNKADVSGETFTGDVYVNSSSQYPKIGIQSSQSNGYAILSYSKPGGNGFDVAYDNANDNLAINRFVGGNYNSTILGIAADGSVSLPPTTNIGGVSSTEIGYLDGVTSSIQAQLDAKASTSSPTFTNPTLSINSSYNSLVTDYLMSYFISASGSNRTMSFGSWTVMLNSTSLVAGDKVLLFSNSGVASTSEPVTVVSFDLNNSQVVLTSTNPAVLTELEAQNIVGGQAYKVIDQSLSITPQNLLRLSNLLNAPKIPANNSTLSVGRYFVPSSIDPFTLTLPASPELGDEIQIFDSGNYAGTQNITINRNGKNINGVADNALLDVNGVAATFIYTGSTYGWRMG